MGRAQPAQSLGLATPVAGFARDLQGLFVTPHGVMDFGQVIARGTPREIQDNPQVIEAYLGRGAIAKAGVVARDDGVRKD